MVNAAQLASYLGVANDDNFKVNVGAAVGSLENHLGYQLCGTADFELREFPYRGENWEQVDPFYDLQSVTIVDTLGHVDDTVTDYLLSQNGILQGDWFNRIRLCGQCFGQQYGEQHGFGRCRWHADCTTFNVSAKWGFAPLTVVTGDNAGSYCTLPDDLFRVLAALVSETSKGDERDLQSESRGSRSYSKFARETVFDRYSKELSKYRNRALFA